MANMNAYDIWQRVVGSDYTPLMALEDASRDGLSISDIALDITSDAQANGCLNGVDSYQTVYIAVAALIEDAFEQQAPNV